jgi:hypothetical protein
MAVRASDRVTLAVLPAPSYVRTYYRLQASTLAAPPAPTTNPPPAPWTTIEPTYTAGSTDTLYTVQLVAYGTAYHEYGPVQKSSAYEAAKAAYNLADTANRQGAAIPRIVHSTSAPTTSNKAPQNSVWMRHATPAQGQPALSGAVIGQWTQTAAANDGSTWTASQVSGQVISNVDVGTLTAGAGSVISLEVTGKLKAAVITSDVFQGKVFEGGTFTGATFMAVDPVDSQITFRVDGTTGDVYVKGEVEQENANGFMTLGTEDWGGRTVPGLMFQRAGYTSPVPAGLSYGSIDGEIQPATTGLILQGPRALNGTQTNVTLRESGAASIEAAGKTLTYGPDGASAVTVTPRSFIVRTRGTDVDGTYSSMSVADIVLEADKGGLGSKPYILVGRPDSPDEALADGFVYYPINGGNDAHWSIGSSGPGRGVSIYGNDASGEIEFNAAVVTVSQLATPSADAPLSILGPGISTGDGLFYGDIRVGTNFYLGGATYTNVISTDRFPGFYFRPDGVTGRVPEIAHGDDAAIWINGTSGRLTLRGDNSGSGERAVESQSEFHAPGVRHGSLGTRFARYVVNDKDNARGGERGPGNWALLSSQLVGAVPVSISGENLITRQAGIYTITFTANITPRHASSYRQFAQIKDSGGTVYARVSNVEEDYMTVSWTGYLGSGVTMQFPVYISGTGTWQQDSNCYVLYHGN